MESSMEKVLQVVQTLSDLFNKRMDAIEQSMLRRYAPLPPNKHCPRCGAALSQAVPDWEWKGSAWYHYCHGKQSGVVRVLCLNECAQPDSEPLGNRENDVPFAKG